MLEVLEAVKGEFCLLEAMRCMLLCMLEAVDGGSVCWRHWRCWR